MKKKPVFRFTALLLLFSTLPLTAQWTRIPLKGGHVDRLIKHPFKENEIYALVENACILKSTDRGYTWTKYFDDMRSMGWDILRALTFSSDGKVFLIADDLLYKSEDDGRTWTAIFSSFLNRRAAEASLSTTESGRIIAWPGFTLNFYLSNDSGNTWNEVQLPSYVKYDVWEVYIDPEPPETIPDTMISDSILLQPHLPTESNYAKVHEIKTCVKGDTIVAGLGVVGMGMCLATFDSDGTLLDTVYQIYEFDRKTFPGTALWNYIPQTAERDGDSHPENRVVAANGASVCACIETDQNLSAFKQEMH